MSRRDNFMSTKKLFNNLCKISLIVYITLLILGIMLKAIMPNDLIANYNFLSTFNLKERLIRGLKIIEFYQIEIELNQFAKAVVLDVLNIFIFIPFGILISHFIKNKKIIKTIMITLIFSIVIELFQLFTIIGSFMLNDLITNIIGGFIGSIVYIIVTKKEKYKIYNILLIVFIIIIILIVSYLLINFIINLDLYKNILMHFN